MQLGRYEEILIDLARKSDRLMVMTAENRAAIRNLPGIIPERFIDVGICEQTMIGAAAGLALRGRTPVVHALATFLAFRAYEFIRTDVGIPGLPVKLVGAVAGFLSDGNGPTHQALEDLSLMRGIPGMHVFCPADEDELVGALPTLIENPAPWYVRYNVLPAAVPHTAPFQVGKAEVLAQGKDVTLLTYGFLLREAAKAKELLEAQHLSVGLVNMRMLKPLDEAAVLAAAKQSSLLVTIEDHFQTGGLYSALGETMLKHRQSARVLPIALEERWFKPGLLPDVLEHEGFTGAKLAQRIVRAL